MALKKKPVTGMKDMLPEEMEIRDYCVGLIKETYKSFGFCSIETPCVEHIENLSSKQGGDNEKLIFKILKRGEKLKLDQAREEADVVDGGLRYDLTVPLSRYYSANANDLPSPFKALQIGNVWRADRPQRGRFRQFMDNLKLAAIVTHVADARTSVLHPASHTHRQLTEEQLIEAGVRPDLIRFSVGIEDARDIISDIKQALEKIK